jgi:hypothetical protein
LDKNRTEPKIITPIYIYIWGVYCTCLSTHAFMAF